MEKIIIHELLPSDIDVVTPLVYRLARRWKYTQNYITQTYIQPSFQYNTFPYIFIAKVDGKYAGNIFLVLEPEGYLEINNQPRITALYVNKKFRNMGVGKNLIQTAKQKAKSLGYSFLYLDTASAYGYYDHIGGWITVGKAHRKKGGKDVVVMKTTL